MKQNEVVNYYFACLIPNYSCVKERTRFMQDYRTLDESRQGVWCEMNTDPETVADVAEFFVLYGKNGHTFDKFVVVTNALSQVGSVLCDLVGERVPAFARKLILADPNMNRVVSGTEARQLFQRRPNTPLTAILPESKASAAPHVSPTQEALITRHSRRLEMPLQAYAFTFRVHAEDFDASRRDLLALIMRDCLLLADDLGHEVPSLWEQVEEAYRIAKATAPSKETADAEG